MLWHSLQKLQVSILKATSFDDLSGRRALDLEQQLESYLVTDCIAVTTLINVVNCPNNPHLSRCKHSERFLKSEQKFNSNWRRRSMRKQKQDSILPHQILKTNIHSLSNQVLKQLLPHFENPPSKSNSTFSPA